MLWENPLGRKRSLFHPFAMDFCVARRIPRIESMKWYGRVNFQDIFLKPLWFSVCCLLVFDNYVHLQRCTRQSLSTMAANGDDNLVDMSSLLQDIAVMDFCSVADGRPSGGYANTCSFWSGLKHCNVWPSILIPLPSWACHFARVSFQIMCKQKVEFPRFANDLYAFGIDLIRSCSSLTATVRSSKETDHRGSAIPAWTGSRLANAMC